MFDYTRTKENRARTVFARYNIPTARVHTRARIVPVRSLAVEMVYGAVHSRCDLCVLYTWVCAAGVDVERVTYSISLEELCEIYVTTVNIFGGFIVL